MNNYSNVGSLWHQWDLHFHTPGSGDDYKNKGLTNKQLVNTLLAEGVRVVAITDHHTMDIDRIRALQDLGKDRLTVLPGIEFRSDQGGKPIHYISIFAEDCDIEHVWDTLKGRLGLTPKAIADKGGDDSIYIPIEKGAAVTRELGGIVTIHAGTKSNSIDSIKNKEQFQRRIKADLTSEWVDIMEIGQIKDIDAHHNIIFPAINLTHPLAICSDNHNITQYNRKTRYWLKADPTFRGLLMVLREPKDRVFIGETPPELRRARENSTKYIQRLSFNRDSSAPKDQSWFSGDVFFNPGLVAIIGNKGSGKSALSDTLGLLGATKNSGSFSFLSNRRFKHPKAGFASFFGAEIAWKSGETESLCLADEIPKDEPERLKYLPQDYVETICNELDGVGKSDFEQELKAVIFSHVPDTLRLGQSTLDNLIQFNTDEKQKRIDTLLKQLRDVSRIRAAAEKEQNPNVRLEIEKQIKQKELEIEVHDKAKPEPVSNPNEAGMADKPDPKLFQNVKDAEGRRINLLDLILEAKEERKRAERKQAVARRLLERIENYQKDYDEFISSLVEDATELNLEADKLISIAFNTNKLIKIRNDATDSIAKEKEKVGEDESEGLQLELRKTTQLLSDLHTKLDATNRAYQAFLKQKDEWTARRTELVGDADTSDSLKGLRAALAALDKLPAKLTELKNKQVEISKEIYLQKQTQVDILRKLYGPVQTFIDRHKLTKDKLKLEFRAELIDQGFSTQFLQHIAQNRKGTFMGIDEGKAKALVECVDWEEISSIEKFLGSVDKALHEDQRETKSQTVQLADQLAQVSSVEAVFESLYGLDYLKPRYSLRWEGKDLFMLSPGERGTLLLVFYLLVDKSDLPLIIDQPEGNLDNHTVAKVLVDCIREARKRRQVFIVTHNPNLAVVCDADQVVHAAMDKENGNTISYTSGALENPKMSQYVTDVLEGTRWAFGVRGDKYKVGDL